MHQAFHLYSDGARTIGTAITMPASGAAEDDRAAGICRHSIEMTR